MHYTCILNAKMKTAPVIYRLIWSILRASPHAVLHPLAFWWLFNARELMFTLLIASQEYRNNLGTFPTHAHLHRWSLTLRTSGTWCPCPCEPGRCCKSCPCRPQRPSFLVGAPRASVLGFSRIFTCSYLHRNTVTYLVWKWRCVDGRTNACG